MKHFTVLYADNTIYLKDYYIPETFPLLYILVYK